MNALVFDTETTGLPLYGSAHPSDAVYQPRMCSIAMALVDEHGAELARFASLIKPVGWPLDDPLFVNNMKSASEKAHGLTFEQLEADGVLIDSVREEWNTLYARATYVCGFNVWFDHKIARGEWKRLGHPIPFREKQGICLMKGSTELCKIERKAPGGGFKFPKLGEAVKILLGKDHTRAHSAEGDLDVSLEIYRYLAERGLLVPEDQPEAKQPAAVAA